MFKFLKNLFNKQENNMQDYDLLKNEVEVLNRLIKEKDSELDKMERQINDMKAEYKELKDSFSKQDEQVLKDEKIRVYKAISQLLINYPTAKNKVEENPELKAKNLLGMMKPLDKLIEYLNLEAIGNVGEEVNYDERVHLPASSNINIDEASKVKIKFVGYKTDDIILDKAKVE
jgi:predicted  nucleic acid-binding Zn-ribbon protein